MLKQAIFAVTLLGVLLTSAYAHEQGESIRDKIMIHLETIKNYPVDAISRGTMTGALEKVKELQQAIDRYANNYDELNNETKGLLIELTQKTYDFHKVFLASRILQKSVSSNVDQNTQFRRRIPAAMHAVYSQTHLALSTKDIEEIDGEEIQRRVQAMNQFATAFFNIDTSALIPKKSQNEFVHAAQNIILTQLEFLVLSFRHRHQHKDDIDFDRYDAELSRCCVSGPCEEAQKIFDHIHKTYPATSDWLMPDPGNKYLIGKVDDLQRAAKEVKTPNSDHEKKTIEERYADYTLAYDSLFEGDPRSSLLATTLAFRSWLGPKKTLDELKAKPYQVLPDNRMTNFDNRSRDATPNLKEMMTFSGYKDLGWLLTHIERDAWRNEMKSACQSALELKETSELLDWPLALGAVLMQDLAGLNYIVPAIEDYVRDNRRAKRTQHIVQASALGIAGLSLLIAPNSVIFPGSIMLSTLTVSLSVLSVVDAYISWNLLGRASSRQDRINGAIIGQLADAHQRQESFKLLDDLRMLRQSYWIAAGSVYFDAGALVLTGVRLAIKSRKQISFVLGQIKDFLKQLKNAPKSVWQKLGQLRPDGLNELVDFIIKHGGTQVANEIIENGVESISGIAVMSTVNGSDAVTDGFQRTLRALNQTDPKTVLGCLYKQPQNPIPKTREGLERLRQEFGWNKFEETFHNSVPRRPAENIRQQLGLIETPPNHVGIPFDEQMKITGDSVVVEIGAGTNPVIDVLPGEKYYIDLWPTNPVITAQQEAILGTRSIAVGTATDLPIESKSVDLLVSHGALGYLNQLQPKMYEALESIFQTLKPNGVAVLDVGAKEASEDAAQVTIFLRDFAAANDVYPKRIHYEWRLTYLKITRLQ